MGEQLYREIILDHSRNPRNAGVIDQPTVTYQDTNPLCGDEVRMDLILADDRVSDVKFSGRGCAISQAAASILTEMVAGQPLDEDKAISREDNLEELGVPISPARMKCAMLGLKVLKSAIYGVPQADDEL
ncbi:MAG: Fe-S cluster assembly sulfur transfer protein SufU [Chloroflexota bacterium]